MGYLPKEPVMLLSVVNTKLRDHYKSLEEFCSAENVEQTEIVKTLEKINYKYHPETNQFS